MNLGEEVRFREHAGAVYADTHGGASWLAYQYFLAGADYLQVRQTRQRGNKDLWYWEARPRIYATPQISVKGWKLEDRNMFELRIKEQIRDIPKHNRIANFTRVFPCHHLSLRGSIRTTIQAEIQNLQKNFFFPILNLGLDTLSFF